MSRQNGLTIGELVRLGASLDGGDFSSCMKFVQDRYGVANLVYVCGSFRGRSFADPFIKTTYSAEWMAYYRSQRYERIDPIVSLAAQSVIPFDWNSVARGTKKVKRMFAEAADAGIGKEGLTIPVRGPVNGIWALLNVTSFMTGREWIAWCDEFLGELVLVASYLHQWACDLHGERNTINFNEISAREREAVAWAADGKGSEEIAELMGCGQRTVKAYFDSVRIKLGACNRIHMVAEAIRAGLVR